MAQLAKQTAAEAARRAIRDATRELQRTYEMYDRDAGLPEAEIDHFTNFLKDEVSRTEAQQAVALELHKTTLQDAVARSPLESQHGYRNDAIAGLHWSLLANFPGNLPRSYSYLPNVQHMTLRAHHSIQPQALVASFCSQAGSVLGRKLC